MSRSYCNPRKGRICSQRDGTAAVMRQIEHQAARAAMNVALRRAICLDIDEIDVEADLYIPDGYLIGDGKHYISPRCASDNDPWLQQYSRK